MLSQIVFITFFLAVCIRNSESVNRYDCNTDQDIVTALEKHPNEIMPILIFKENDPLISDEILKSFTNEYGNVIVADNSNNGCQHTNEILRGGRPEANAALSMVSSGQLVKPNRVIAFRYDTLNTLRNATTSHVVRSIRGTSLAQEILKKINDTPSLVGQVVGTVRRGTASKRNHNQGESSGQARPPTNTQMTTPTMSYQNYGMIRSIESGQGQSSGQPRPPTITQMTTSMLNYPSFPITMPYESVPTMPNARLPTMSIPPTQQTLFRPTAEYAIPRRPGGTQNLLIRMENQAGRGNNLAGSSHRANDLDGSHLKLSTDSNDDWKHKDKKPKYREYPTSSRK